MRLSISKKIAKIWPKIPKIIPKVSGFSTVNRFSAFRLIPKIYWRIRTFLRKAVYFPEIIPNSETLTGTHGLSQHVKLVHSDKRKFECSTTFLHAGALQRHVQVVHEKVKPFSCPICEKTFTQNCRVKHHVKLVHEKPVKNSSMVDVEDS